VLCSVLPIGALRPSLSMKDFARAPNSASQRSGTHKVLGRGRPSPAHGLLPRARVLTRWRAAAELGS
jgi:hypothetical protein